MTSFIAAIKAQEAYKKKPKPKREVVVVDRRPPLKDAQIVQALNLLKLGLTPRDIAKELEVPAQTIYNVRQRYQIIELEDGRSWYRYLGV